MTIAHIKKLMASSDFHELPTYAHLVVRYLPSSKDLEFILIVNNYVEKMKDNSEVAFNNFLVNHLNRIIKALYSNVLYRKASNLPEQISDDWFDQFYMELHPSVETSEYWIWLAKQNDINPELPIDWIKELLWDAMIPPIKNSTG